MLSKCVVCHDRDAVYRCLECHKPVCDECAFKTDQGAFCSRRCSARYMDFKRAQRPAKPTRKRGHPIALLLVVVALAAITFAVAWRQGWLPSSWRVAVRQKAVSGLEKARDYLEEEETGEGSGAPEDTSQTED